MSTITFHGENGLAQLTMERGAELRIAGGTVSAGGSAFAHLQDGAWQLGMQRFDRITCKGPVCVELDSRSGSRCLGPFAELTIGVDLVTSAKQVVARYRSSERRWQFDSRSEAEALILKDV